jgi:ribosomal protein S18 acetylase RimI-like enzyme
MRSITTTAASVIGRARGCGRAHELHSMSELRFQTVDQFPEPAFSALSREAFSDYEQSALLTRVLEEESAARSNKSASTQADADAQALRIAAFRDQSLVGWTYARRCGAQQLHMINSGVAPAERRQGIYSQLVRRTILHATSQGYVSIHSRHAASNNPVIVAKLKLGFFVSGFEYSEVYGPLVRLTYFVGDLRRDLHQARSRPIRRVE